MRVRDNMEHSPSTSPTKHLSVTMPDFSGGGSNFISQRSESKTLTSKMRKILASPKVMKGKSIPSPNKTFGVPLEFISDRDGCDVPLIVSRICEYLKINGIHQEGLFRVNGNMKVVERLKTAFDKCGDADLEEIGDVPAAASLLKMFLRELTDPVIPEEFQYLFINIQDNHSQEKTKAITMMSELVKQMPKRNTNLLKYLCKFMLDIATGSERNKMTPLALAIVFGPNIFRCGEGLEGLKDQAFVNAVLLDMLQNYEEIFESDENGGNNMSKPPEKPLPYIEHMRQKQEQEKHKDKPARPPPPNLNLIIDNKQRYIEDQISPRALSPQERRLLSPANERRSLKMNVALARKEAANRKKSPVSTTPSNSSPSSYSPPLTPNFASPLSRQLVDTTINSAVKEHLFGPGVTVSSADSDLQEDLSATMIGEQTGIANVYPCVKDRVKKLNEYGTNGAKKDIKFTKQTLSDEDFDYIERNSSTKLEGLTHDRAQLPKTRRKPSFRSRSESNNGEGTTEETNKNIKNNKPKPAVNRDLFDRKMSEDFNQPKETSEKLKSLRNSVAPVKRSTPVTPNERLLSVSSINRKADDSDHNQPEEVMVSIPPLDLSRLQDDDGEARRSPRGRYKIFDHGEAIRSPHSKNSSPDHCDQPRIKRNEVWNEKRQDTVPIIEMTPQDLKKRILSLKKIISNFENNFEEQNGRKPKPSDKTHIQKYIAELGRTKKQLRELLSDYNENVDFLAESAPVGSDFGTAPNLREPLNTPEEKSKEKTLNTLLKRLEDKRLQQGRPQEIQAMTIEQLKEEKLSVQKALLQYENSHGRPTTKDDKTLMRPLYDRYRKIKRLIASGKSDTRSIENEFGSSDQNLPRLDSINSSPERGTLRERLVEVGKNEKNNRLSLSPQDDEKLNRRDDDIIPVRNRSFSRQSNSNQEHFSDPYNELGDTFAVTKRLQEIPEPLSPVDSPRSIDEAILHNATISELLEQQRNTKRTKKRLGKLLKDFEEDFFNTWNRKVQKEDRLPKEAEYREYKLIKSKLRLVEALIAKKAANQTV